MHRADRASDKAFAAGADIKEMQPKALHSTCFPPIFNRCRCRPRRQMPQADHRGGGGLTHSRRLRAGDDVRTSSSPPTPPNSASRKSPSAPSPAFGGTAAADPRGSASPRRWTCASPERMMDATEAERSGLVSRIVPADKLMEEVMAAAEKIAAMSRPAAAMAKESHQPRPSRHSSARRTECRTQTCSIRHLPWKTAPRAWPAFIEKRKAGEQEQGSSRLAPLSRRPCERRGP